MNLTKDNPVKKVPAQTNYVYQYEQGPPPKKPVQKQLENEPEPQAEPVTR
jgi:hypothetical protein